jgi:hypothetical protein
MRFITILFFTFYTNFAAAQVVSYTINFNGLSGIQNVGNIYNENGFTITGDGVGFFYSGNGYMYHGAANAITNAVGRITLSQTDGSLFTLDSMSIAPYNTTTRPTINITFTAHFEDGHTISQTFSPPVILPYDTQVSFLNFKDVKSVSWEQWKAVSPPANIAHRFGSISVKYDFSTARAIFLLMIFGAGAVAVLVPQKLERLIERIFSLISVRA